jgi:hypothetical protein
MITRLSAFNRAAVIILPLLAFVTCCVSLIAGEAGKSLFEAGRLAWSFGHERGFPLIALAGLGLGLADWCFPKKKKIFVSSAFVVSALAVFFGWALAALIVEL